MNLNENISLETLQKNLSTEIKNNTKFISSARKPKRWWDDEISNLYYQRQSALNEWKQNQTGDNFEKYIN